MGLFNLFKKNKKESNIKEDEFIHFSTKQMDEYESFIKTNFGESYKVFHELVSPDIHLDVLIVEPSEKRNYYTLVTMGVSGYKMIVPDELKENGFERAELVMYLPTDWNFESKKEEDTWPLEQIKRVARLPIYAKTWLGLGHTTSKDEKNTPFASNTKLCSVILLSLLRKECNISGLGNINFYTLVPLYEEELKYKFENGFDKLMDLFEEYNMPLPPVIDINRKNMCLKDKENNIDKNEIINNKVFNGSILEFVGNKVEEKSQLDIMLKDIGYLENKEEYIKKITRCEILDCSDYGIKNINISDNNIELQYELNYILQALIDKEFIYKITGICNCKLTVPIEYYSVLSSTIGMNRLQILEYKDKIKFIEIKYENVECDCLYV